MIVRLIRWRISVTMRFLRALWRHPFLILGGAALGYVTEGLIALCVMIALEAAQVTYSDLHASYAVTVLVGVAISMGGFLGYRYGERR